MELDFRAPGKTLSLDGLLRRALSRASAAEVAELEVSVGREGKARGSGLAVSVRPGERVRLEISREQWGQWADPVHLALRSRAPEGAVHVLCLAPAWRSGTLEGGKGESLGFRVEEVRDGVARVVFDPSVSCLGRVLELIAGAGFPALGDCLGGGVLVRGAPHLAPLEETWDWPAHVFAEPTPLPVLRVSRATQRVLERGHPWILADAESDDAARFPPGSRVAVCGESGHEIGVALIDGIDAARPAARMWTRGTRRARPSASVETRVAAALERRKGVLERAAREGTDALRLIHAEADALPGIAVDRYGPLLRVRTEGRAAETFRGAVVGALVEALEPELGREPPIVEVIDVRPRPSGRLECVRGGSKSSGRFDGFVDPQTGRVTVRERGLAFGIDPGLASPHVPTPGVGLYCDQRENRRRVASRVHAGGRWLNLFAHTGAFSLALLAAGADEVTSVDLSAAYLRWLDDNLRLNPHLDSKRHRSVRQDGRRYLDRLAQSRASGAGFEGIVLDPPTAAAAGRRFWSVRRDLEPLIERALSLLAPGGHLLVCRNDRGRRTGLAERVQAVASRVRVRLHDVQPAPPGPDFPRSEKFPEGDPFAAVLATRSR